MVTGKCAELEEDMTANISLSQRQTHYDKKDVETFLQKTGRLKFVLPVVISVIST